MKKSLLDYKILEIHSGHTIFNKKFLNNSYDHK